MTADKKKYINYDILGAKYQLPLVDSGSKTKEHILMQSTILFAKKGFASVSMRELAEVIGIKPASLYNHFESKETLWEAVLTHASDLYLLYFRHLNDSLEGARSFKEVVDVMFLEPEKFSNLFTCYAFCLVQSEQFRDERSGGIFCGTFLEYSINFIKGWFDKCVERDQAAPFDTKTVATFFMHSVLIGINVKVQEALGRPTPYDPTVMIGELHQYILDNAARRAREQAG